MASQDQQSPQEISLTSLETPASNADNRAISDAEASLNNFAFQSSDDVGQRAEPISAYPEGGKSAWLVLLAAFCMIASTYGLMTSIGVLQWYLESHQLAEYTDSQIAWIPSVLLFLNFLFGVQVGPLLDRYGPRWITLIGSVGYVASILMFSFCSRYWQFMLCLGVLAGISSTLVSTSALVSLSHWFEKRRGMVIGIAMSGSSMGGILFPLLLRSAFDRLGWAWAIRILGFIIFVLVAIGNILIRGRLPTQIQGGMVDFRCLRDSRFLWATLGVCCRCKSLCPRYSALTIPRHGTRPLLRPRYYPNICHLSWVQRRSKLLPDRRPERRLLSRALAPWPRRRPHRPLQHHDHYDPLHPAHHVHDLVSIWRPSGRYVSFCDPLRLRGRRLHQLGTRLYWSDLPDGGVRALDRHLLLYR